jgi:ubiquinone/menaquinone biosynthesis C-methylase UbiE
MLKRFPPALLRRCLDEAARSPMANGAVEYPEWYLQRWHFLPEGYLSRRSAALYDRGIRRLYWQLRDGAGYRAVAAELAGEHPSAILELGCGPGHGLVALAAAFPAATITGLDLSPFLLERARERVTRAGIAGRVELVHGSALALPWHDGRFDAVMEAHLFGHMPGKAATVAIGEARRVLRPGGLLAAAEHRWHRLPLRPARERPFTGGIIRIAFERTPAAG